MQAASHPLTPTRRIGQVISYSATPAPTVEVTIGGDPTVTVFAPFLDPYIPVVGDYVVLLGTLGDYVVVGPVATTTNRWVSSSGTLIVGTYDPGKPVQTYYRRQNSATDANAIIGFSSPAAMSALLWASAEVAAASSTARRLHIREDLCDANNVRFQLKDLTNNAANMINTTIVFTAIVHYQ